MLSVGLEGGSANSLADMLLSSAPQRLSTNSYLSGSWRSLIMETTQVIYKEHSFTQSTGPAPFGPELGLYLELHKSRIITGNI